ncbi:DUF2799 domain-containing protein [Chitinilyticum litopenaei]|uniref:DUF2799 domain-containing protein n=1 Tax=Chitinilyticum litopenaei TaxID=1121276 RepID=UPI00041A92B1|nr:DUF2799 domain-containing protein [Chitinilyticum litopenaei]
MKSLPLALLLPCVLSACAALSERECRQANWQALGLRDGQLGKPVQLQAYAEACRELGITPVAADYHRGRDLGLQAYCTPERGYRAGLAGETNHNVCPAASQAGFLRAYLQGRDRYLQLRDINALENRLLGARHDVRKLEDRLARTSDDGERRRLQRRIAELERQQSRDRLELDRLRLQLHGQPHAY